MPNWQYYVSLNGNLSASGTASTADEARAEGIANAYRVAHLGRVVVDVLPVGGRVSSPPVLVLNEPAQSECEEA